MNILSCFFKYFPVTPNTTTPKVNPKDFGTGGDVDDIITQKNTECLNEDILRLLQKTI